MAIWNNYMVVSQATNLYINQTYTYKPNPLNVNKIELCVHGDNR